MVTSPPAFEKLGVARGRGYIHSTWRWVSHSKHSRVTQLMKSQSFTHCTVNLKRAHYLLPTQATSVWRPSKNFCQKTKQKLINTSQGQLHLLAEGHLYTHHCSTALVGLPLQTFQCKTTIEYVTTLYLFYHHPSYSFTVLQCDWLYSTEHVTKTHAHSMYCRSHDNPSKIWISDPPMREEYCTILECLCNCSRFSLVKYKIWMYVRLSSDLHVQSTVHHFASHLTFLGNCDWPMRKE